MNGIAALPIGVRLALVCVAGVLAGFLAVRAWLAMRHAPRREGLRLRLITAAVVLFSALGLAAVYWWEVERQGLKPHDPVVFLAGVQGVVVPLPAISPIVLHAQFLCHAVLLCLMLLASLIDIDEQIIPDAITVPGTWLGLIMAAAYPWALLPVGEVFVAGGKIQGAIGFLTLTSPLPWPAPLGGWPNAGALVLALGCWWLWSVGLMERPWRSRHGWRRAFGLMMARLVRADSTRLILVMAVLGSLAIAAVWCALPGAHWTGLLSALVGMTAGGLLIWLVRVIAGPVLGREAMGFGDVTLMAMIGTFLGWQSCLVVFFVAPMVGLVVGVAVLLIGRSNVIPYGPFLCLGALTTLVWWARCWAKLEELLSQLGLIVPLIVLIALAMMIPLLFLVRAVKESLGRLFGGK